MKIKLIKWGTFPPKTPFLVKIPYEMFGEFAAHLDEMAVKPVGLIPPSLKPHRPKRERLEFTARSAATARDFFPDFPVYVPLPLEEPRDFARAARGAGFKHFVFPLPPHWNFYWQQVHDLLADRVIHVAGGSPPADWLFPGGKWTWSEEKL